MTKVKTKYDCRFYCSKGGHCEKSRSGVAGCYTTVSGCSHPNDISKCRYNQLASECKHYRGYFQCAKTCRGNGTCDLYMYRQDYCAFFEKRKKVTL